MTELRDHASPSPMNRAQFHAAFPLLASAFLEEWPQVEPTLWSATNGELDKVVGLIVEKTGHTKTLAKRQLEELYHLITAPAVAAAGSDSRTASSFVRETRAAADSVSQAAHDALHAVESVLEQFEKKTRPLLRNLRGNVITQTYDKVREHWLVSIFAALGLGFIAAILVGGLTHRK